MGAIPVIKYYHPGGKVVQAQRPDHAQDRDAKLRSSDLILTTLGSQLWVFTQMTKQPKVAVMRFVEHWDVEWMGEREATGWKIN